MARVKYGGIVTDLSGSIGGSTFQRSSFGSSLRSKPNPIRGRSASQGNIRYLMSKLHAAWRGMTEAQRTAWSRYTNFSNQSIRHDKNVLISGHALFIKYNLAKLMIGDAIITDLIYISMPQFPTFAQIGSDGATMIFDVGDVYDEALMFCLVKLTSPRVPSRSFSPQGLRNIPLTYDGSGTFGINAAYQVIFGFVPSWNLTLHFSLQWFCRTAPIMAAPIVGKTIIVAI